MRRAKLLLLVAGFTLLLFGLAVTSGYAADKVDKTVTVKVTVHPDFWSNTVTFPNGNKAMVNGVAVILMDKGVPQVFKTISQGQTGVTFTYTGEQEAAYQVKLQFFAGPGAAVSQTEEKIKNYGQTLTYDIGVDKAVYPLKLDRDQRL